MGNLTWRTKAGAVTLFALFALAAGALFDASDTRAQPPVKKKVPGPVPVVDVRGLMMLFNKPLYQHLKEDIAEKPADKKAWLNLEERGLQLAEVANLIALRKVKPPHEEWLELALNLQRAGLALAKAANAQDWNLTVQSYRGLIQRCNDCHRIRAPDKAPTLQP
jgi:hypothetical protein